MRGQGKGMKITIGKQRCEVEHEDRGLHSRDRGRELWSSMRKLEEQAGREDHRVLTVDSRLLLSQPARKIAVVTHESRSLKPARSKVVASKIAASLPQITAAIFSHPTMNFLFILELYI
ncbi:unnamed protein product [Linum trigynum]|uniref:Uncharacterized protein n=1 Tax=Linum trigynum TaxID=586398 RepID=A0AAV2G6J0_9ROSI